MSVRDLEVVEATQPPITGELKRPPGSFLRPLRSFARFAAITWQVVGVALLWLVVLNLVAWLFLGTKDRDPAATETAMASLSTNDRDLAQRFAEESARLNGVRVRGEMMRWEPYAYWRMRESKGQFVNVGPDGLRRTTPSKVGDSSAPRIYLFGGSVMWGTGARDEHTIPSYLSEMLHESGVDAEVVNLAQIGYVSTQELAAFEQCCRQQNVPAVAVFYHGVNDVFSAIVNGQPGLTMHEANRDAEFNLLNRDTPGPALAALLRNLPLYRVIDPSCEPAQVVNLRARTSLNELAMRRSSDPQLMQRLNESLALRPLAPHETSDDRLLTLVIEELMSGAADWMKTNAEIAVTLGVQFGAQVVNVWQPTVFSKEAPSPFERQVINREPLLRTAFKSADRYIDGMSAPGTENEPGDFRVRQRRIFTLAGVLDGNDWAGETAFTDFCHVNEPANRAIARALLPLVLEALKHTSHEHRGDHT